MSEYINVIGAGLAGCEASWQIAGRGIKVKLYEMKPARRSPAHSLDTFAELVCSNSFRSNRLENAAGLLKQEMRLLDSLIIQCADKCSIPAGSALAVDRSMFSSMVTERIRCNSNIEIIHKEVNDLPGDALTVVATGPLTSNSLAGKIKKLLGKDYLYFHDAAAPIVLFETINMDRAFKASRYGRGSDDYINCPMDRHEYGRFWENLVGAEAAELKDFEKNSVFEGCLPIEIMAGRGTDTLRYGPLKPVGLTDPSTGKEPYAVVQLRQDNSKATLYNIVGFQTHLKHAEQKRVFRMIPGLENAEFVRYGVMHRNTYIKSPGLLDNTYNLSLNTGYFFAGQITGVEGYLESAASGLAAGINAAKKMRGEKKLIFPGSTAIGGLAHYISNKTIRNFQPMNINFGIMDTPIVKIKSKKDRNLHYSKQSIGIINSLIPPRSNRQA